MIKISVIKQRIEKEKIIVLIDGLGTINHFYYLIKKFIPSKYGYLQYSYSKNILNENSLETKENFLQLLEKISKDLADLEKIKKRTFSMFSCSLGGLFCMILADKIKVKKMMLVAPGYNLAEAFYFGQGKRTKKIKKKMIEKYLITLPTLKETWKEISPDSYFKEKSHQTEFFIILSKNDGVIPTSSGQQLIDLLEKEKIKSKIIWTNLSHRIICLKELLFIKNFKKWLSE